MKPVVERQQERLRKKESGLERGQKRLSKLSSGTSLRGRISLLSVIISVIKPYIQEISSLSEKIDEAIENDKPALVAELVESAPSAEIVDGKIASAIKQIISTAKSRIDNKQMVATEMSMRLKEASWNFNDNTSSVTYTLKEKPKPEPKPEPKAETETMPLLSTAHRRTPWAEAGENSLNEANRKAAEIEKLRARAARYMDSRKRDMRLHITKVKKEKGCHIRTRHIEGRGENTCPMCEAAIANGDKSKALKTPLHWDDKTNSLKIRVHVKPRKTVTMRHNDKDVEAYRMDFREIRKAEREYKQEQNKQFSSAKIAKLNQEQIKQGVALLEKLAKQEAEPKAKKTKPKESTKYVWPGRRQSIDGIKTRRIIR